MFTIAGAEVTDMMTLPKDDVNYLSKELINTPPAINSRFKNQINDALLYRYGFGFINNTTKSINTVVSWSEEEHDYFHRWSYKTLLSDYGYYSLNKYFGNTSDYMKVKMVERNRVLKYTIEAKNKADEEKAKYIEEQQNKLEKQQKGIKGVPNSPVDIGDGIDDLL